MENNKTRTIEELFVEKYQKLEEDNKRLKTNVEFLKAFVKTQEEETELWKDTYYELVNRLKEDFNPEISKTSSNETYFKFRHNFIHENNKEKDKYYIDLFKLKEEGEDNEIQ